jgi:hypothetical protein
VDLASGKFRELRGVVGKPDTAYQSPPAEHKNLPKNYAVYTARNGQ